MANNHQFVLHKFNHVWLNIINNQYFRDIKRFIQAHFDTPEYANTIIFIGGITIGEEIARCRVEYPGMKLIAYNWEQLCGGNQWVNVNQLIANMQAADEIWDYDELNADYAKMFCGVNVSAIHHFQYFHELEHNNLDDEKRDIDVLFTGLLNERRAKILSSIHMKSYDKFKTIVALGTSCEDVDALVARSKIVLNIHGFEPYSRQEQSRIGAMLANRVCVVSEVSQLNHFGDAIIQVTSDNFVPTIVDLLADSKWREQGDRGYGLFKANTMF